MSGDVIDYKAKCEQLASENTKLTAEKASLEQVCDILKAEVARVKGQFNNTVAAHNQQRDQLMTALSELSAGVARGRFLTIEELDQQAKQVEDIKEKLKSEAGAKKQG